MQWTKWNVVVGKIRAHQKLVIASVLFALVVLLFTRMDYVVNVVLYRFGLRFSEGWFSDYSLAYTLMYQLTILCLFIYCRRIAFLLLTEVFVLTSTQDLVFFSLWNQGVYPSGQWTWTRYYRWFGSWTTMNQIIYSAVSLTTAFIVVIIGSRWRKARSRTGADKKKTGDTQ